MNTRDSINFSLTLDDTQFDELAAELERRLSLRAGQQSSPWLNTEEAARYLCCPKSRILKLVHRGDLPRSKDGRRNLYSREDLDRFIENGGASCP